MLMSDSRHAISLKRNFEGVKKFAAQKRHTTLLKKRWIKRLKILIYLDTNYIQPKSTRLFISLLTCPRWIKSQLKKSRSCQSLFLAQKKLKRSRIERKKKRFELIWTINFYDQKRNRIKETAFHLDSFSFNKVITTTWINF